MASSCLHWVDELFPPRFKLNTSFECGEPKSDIVHRKKLRDVQEIYEDVFSAMVSPEEGQESDTLKLLVKPKEFVERRGREVNAAESSRSEEKTKRRMTKSDCIWSTDELKVLRNSLKRSRLNNIRLSVLTRSLQRDCEHLRNICDEQAREILDWNKKYNDVRKQNKRMKITSKAFKEDAKKCNVDLEECQGLLQVAANDRECSELKLVQTNKELEATRKQCKVLTLELEKQKMLQDRLLKNQRIAMELTKAREIDDLIRKMEDTQLKLEKEKNDHAINKKALDNLRLHFASGRT